MLTVYTDGGSRGNPGKAACAFVAVRDNKIIKEHSKFLGIATNNEAEYNAIIQALQAIKENELEIISDSKVVIRQLNGQYKIKVPHLQELKNKIDPLLNDRKIKFSNTSREDKFISHADFLVNQELDKN